MRVTQAAMFGEADVSMNDGRVHKVHKYPVVLEEYSYRETSRMNTRFKDAQEAADLAELDRLRPKTRAECHANRMKIMRVDSIEKAPCPWMGCRFHLHLDKSQVGALQHIKLYDGPEDHTCVLDEVDNMVGEGELTDAQVDWQEMADAAEDAGEEFAAPRPMATPGTNAQEEAAHTRVAAAFGVSGEWARQQLKKVSRIQRVKLRMVGDQHPLVEYRDHASGADYGTQVHVRVVG
jgi:hypothetical protein